jgi:integrase
MATPAKRAAGLTGGKSRHHQPKARVLGRHQLLLENPKVRSWWESRSLRSQLSADQYLRQFGFLLERIQLDADQVVRLAQRNPDKLRDLLVRDAAKLKQEGKLDSYIAKFVEGLKAYLKFHRVAFDGFPSLSPIKGESLVNERIPSPEELGRCLDGMSIRGRAIALFIAHSGVRPGVLAAYQATSGLRLRDLPDLELGKTPSFSNMPFVIRVPASLSKTRVAYTTFGSAQLASAFLAYLDVRQKEGEKLSPDSPVIAVRPLRGMALKIKTRAEGDSQFLTTNTLVKEIHDALAESAPKGVRWRPYVLRSYCSTRLLMAEGGGKITRDLREALLGHDGGISARYNVGKTWGPDLLKEARTAYKRAESYLNTVQTKAGDDVFTEMRKGLLLDLGYTEDELKGIDLAELTSEKFHELVANKRAEFWGGAAPNAPQPAPRVPPPRGQKVVSESEVDQLVAQGWTVHTQFVGNKRVVLNPPSE